MTYTATYSPEDNQLRLYSSTRLDRDLYARVRGAGFIYAPKQELFVAPMWTPRTRRPPHRIVRFDRSRSRTASRTHTS
jgi:hypothetical protein